MVLSGQEPSGPPSCVCWTRSRRRAIRAGGARPLPWAPRDPSSPASRPPRPLPGCRVRCTAPCGPCSCRPCARLRSRRRARRSRAAGISGAGPGGGRSGGACGRRAGLRAGSLRLRSREGDGRGRGRGRGCTSPCLGACCVLAGTHDSPGKACQTPPNHPNPNPPEFPNRGASKPSLTCVKLLNSSTGMPLTMPRLFTVCGTCRGSGAMGAPAFGTGRALPLRRAGAPRGQVHAPGRSACAGVHGGAKATKPSPRPRPHRAKQARDVPLRARVVAGVGVRRRRCRRARHDPLHAPADEGGHRQVVLFFDLVLVGFVLFRGLRERRRML